ncbi:MAG: hypothetical protein K6G31_00310 [Paludibacteraceae bacterium]|nr:hypothetical protein [Paludibacteraceae bacterium]
MCECSRSLTFAKLLPYAKGLRFVVANLLVDDFQLVKGRDFRCEERGKSGVEMISYSAFDV